MQMDVEFNAKICLDLICPRPIHEGRKRSADALIREFPAIAPRRPRGSLSIIGPVGLAWYEMMGQVGALSTG